jgi:hypothetical protein
MGREGPGGRGVRMLVLEPGRERPITCTRRSSSSIRAIPRANASRSSEPIPSGSHSFLYSTQKKKRNQLPQERVRKREGDVTYQISRRRCGPSLDLSHILRTRRPSSLASGPGSRADAGAEYVFDSKSIDSPRQPAFWRLVGAAGGGGLGVCARTLAMKSASYRARGACFAPGPGVGVENDVREESEVREVVVPCEKREEWSEAVVVVDWTDARAEGGRERGCEGRGGGTDVGGGGGGKRRVIV